MASSKDRERKLARAKIERQMRNRADRSRRQRQAQARIGAALAIVLVAVGVFWGFGGFHAVFGKKSTATTIADSCTWVPADTTQNKDLVSTGTPPPSGEPTTGTETMTITTNHGAITASLDVAAAPCTAASFSYLATTKFFDNTSCHRLTTTGIYVLQCGDPSGTGSGGPSYTFADENLPLSFAPAPGASPAPSASDATPSQVIYPAGTLAMANTGAAASNGSQFFIVYRDSPLAPSYTVFGKITGGLNVVTTVAKAGVKPATTGGSTTDGPPKSTVTIQTMTVAPDVPGSPAPSLAPQPSGAPTPSSSASTKS